MTQSEIMEIIDEEGVEFIRLQFTDIFGTLKNLAVTPGQMAKVFANLCSFDPAAIFDGEHRYYNDKLYLYPDLDTFTILPWRPQQGKVAKVVCDVYDAEGKPFAMSSRKILKDTLAKMEERGYTFKVDPECEFFLFHTDEHGLPTTVSHEQAGYMDVGPVDFGENARRDIVLMLEEMGFEIESSHHEHAPAQHEIVFQYAEAMKMADDIQTFRFAVRSIAKRFGLYATFMPKPRADFEGSGMHTNITVYKDGKNIFRSVNGKVNDEVYYFIGGILKHAAGLAAIANSSVNSYKRLIPDTEAPSLVNWSTREDGAMVKLNTYLDYAKAELRFPDGACNPYLLLATCIAAGMDGIDNKIDPGVDISTLENKNTGDKLPGNLKEAVDALLTDELLIEVLGKEFTDIYAQVKYGEWNEYMKSVSEWEINRYLNRI